MKYLFISILSCLLTSGFSQVAGNQVFSGTNTDNYNNNIYFNNQRTVSLSDSTFVINSRVLINLPADYYIVTFGVSELQNTVALSNEVLNKRIERFMNSVLKLDIINADIYNDFVAQYKVYDLKKVSGQDWNVEEYLKGIETVRNIIIKYNDKETLEKLIIAAAKDSIYDLIKVDYLVEDPNKVYNDLFKAATEIINNKKELYTGLTAIKLKPASQIYRDNFQSYSPTERYKSYKAYSSNLYDYYWYDSSRKKLARKFTTFYYDKLNYSGFDKIINPGVVEPQVQFVLELEVKYEIAK